MLAGPVRVIVAVLVLLGPLFRRLLPATLAPSNAGLVSATNTVLPGLSFADDPLPMVPISGAIRAMPIARALCHAFQCHAPVYWVAKSSSGGVPGAAPNGTFGNAVPAAADRSSSPVKLAGDWLGSAFSAGTAIVDAIRLRCRAIADVHQIIKIGFIGRRRQNVSLRGRGQREQRRRGNEGNFHASHQPGWRRGITAKGQFSRSVTGPVYP